MKPPTFFFDGVRPVSDVDMLQHRCMARELSTIAGPSGGYSVETPSGFGLFGEIHTGATPQSVARFVAFRIEARPE